jgi:hypothetical protein
MNIFFIGFGEFEDNPYIWAVTRIFEIFFLLEILAGFVTEYTDKDGETEVRVNTLAKTIRNFIFNGDFFILTIAWFPFFLIYPPEVDSDN